MRAFTLLFLTLIFSSAMAGGPKVKSITADSESAKPGEVVTIKVILKGNAKNVSSMEFIVREFPYDVPPFVLSASEGKKNKEWVATIPIPFEAPAGNYNLELRVKLKDGTQVETGDSAGNQHGKAGTLSVSVN